MTAAPVTEPLKGLPAARAFAADIKLSHSIFALPFALLAATLAAMSNEAVWGETWGVASFVLILVCMVAARTVAMAANRMLDAQLDTLNPRTARRAIPAGQLARGWVALTASLFATAFVLACAGFWWIYGNVWPLALSVPVLAFLCGYPLLKRFTSLCHYYLGAALALSPICAWIAMTGGVAIEPFLMAGGVLCWTAGFDVIYATADHDSDVRHGVHSLPSRLGIGRALWASRGTHVVGVGFLLALGVISPLLGAIWFAAVGVVAALLVVEHRLVRPDDLSKVSLAFFTVNGVISTLLGTAGIVDALI